MAEIQRIKELNRAERAERNKERKKRTPCEEWMPDGGVIFEAWGSSVTCRFIFMKENS